MVAKEGFRFCGHFIKTFFEFVFHLLGRSVASFALKFEFSNSRFLLPLLVVGCGWLVGTALIDDENDDALRSEMRCAVPDDSFKIYSILYNIL
jgi:hypothetical protein